jgi:signal transduction histidine kinase
MAERLPRELHAFQNLARVVATSPVGAEAILERICADVRTGFGLARASVLAPEELAARHPLVEQAREARRAVTDGTRVAVPLAVDDLCLGLLIGDAAGEPLELDDADLGLLTALASVAAVFVMRARDYDRLEQSLDARDTFVSLASHELRTPIAVVHGIVSTLHLRGEALEPHQVRELRATAFAQTTRLARLTEQLLDLSRLEARRPAILERRFLLRELVDELLLRIAPERRRDVVVEVDPELEVESDPDAVERVVSNLIVNALRYGEPPVVVRAEDGDRLDVLVEDAGPGIDPELVPRLFDRFSRGSEDPRGAGLGLAIARSYAEALGATLAYEPRLPRGARFRLVLPARAGSANPL